MKRILLFITVFILTQAKPNGLYHQQYQYQSSSSQYRNNQLQQKTQDEGYFSQHGDLAGRQEPITDSYSSHIRYTNPKSATGDDEDLTQQTEDFDSKALKLQQHGSTHGSSYGASGLRYQPSYSQQDLSNSGSYGSRSSYSYSGSYNTGSRYANTGNSYNQNTELQALEQKLQEDLSRQLQTAVASNGHRQSSYSTSYSNNGNINADAELQRLQEELSRNLTQQLQQEIQRSSSGHRGSYSYTISTGHPHSSYNNQDLQQLQRNLQSNLENQLRESLQQQQNGNTQKVYVVKTYGINSNLGSITKQIEDELSQKLQDAVRNQHLQSSSYSHYYSTNSAQMNADLEKLKEELRRNLTQQLEEQLQKTYGSQGSRGSYSYTISTSGKYSPTANYDNQELNDLKKQLENNLLNQLEKDVITEYSQTSSHSTQTVTNQNSGRYVPYRPSSYNQRNYDNSASRVTGTTGTYVSRPVINVNSDSQRTSTYSSRDNTYQRPVNTDNNFYLRPSRPTTIQTTTTEDVEEIDDMQKPVEIETFLTNTNQQTEKPKSHILPTDNTQVVRQPGFEITRPRPSYATSTTNQQTYYTTVYRPVVQPSIELSTIIKKIQDDLTYDITSAYVQDQIRLYKEKYEIGDNDVDFNVVLREIKNDFKSKLNKKIQDELYIAYGDQVEYGSYSYTQPTSNTVATANYKLEDLNDLKRQTESALLKKLTDTVRQEETRYTTQHQTYSTSYQTNGNRRQLHKYGTFNDNTRNYQTEQIPSQTTGTNSRHITYTYSTTTQDLDSQLNSLKTDFENQLKQQLQAYRNQQTSQLQQHDEFYWNNLQEELRNNLTKQLQETIQEKYGRRGQVGGVTYTITSTNPDFNYDQKIKDFTKQLEADLTQQLTDGFSKYTVTSQNNYGYSRPSYSNQQVVRSFGSYSSSSGHQHEEFDPDCMHDDPTSTSIRAPLSHTFDAKQMTQTLLESEQQNKVQHQQTITGYGNNKMLTPHQKPDDSTNPKVNQQVELGQQIEDEAQQIEDNDQQLETIDYSELTQQAEDDFGQIELTRSQQKPKPGQQIIDEDDFGQIQLSRSPQKPKSGQQIIDEDDFGQIQLSRSQQKPKPGQQIIDDNISDMGQQTEDDFGQLQISGSQQKHRAEEQMIDEDDFGQVQISQQSSQKQLETGQQIIEDNIFDMGQQIEDDLSDLTQQTEDDFGQLQVSGHLQKQQSEQQTIDQLNLNRQTSYKHSTSGQQVIDENTSDLRQQTEDDFGQLQLSGHGQKQESGQQSIDDDYFDQLHVSVPTSQQHIQVNQHTVEENSADLNQQSRDLTQQLEKGFETQNNVNQRTIHHSSYESSSSYSQSHSSTYNSGHSNKHIIESPDSQVDETTPKPGFWKRLGQSIESSYQTAKDKTKSVLG